MQKQDGRWWYRCGALSAQKRLKCFCPVHDCFVKLHLSSAFANFPETYRKTHTHTHTIEY